MSENIEEIRQAAWDVVHAQEEDLNSPHAVALAELIDRVQRLEHEVARLSWLLLGEKP